MSSTTERQSVVGVFHDRAQAEEAVEALHEAGFRDDQIGFAARDSEAPAGSQTIGEGTEAGEGAAKGLVGGGIIGGVLGALATGLIPGIGPVIAGGLLAGILGGAAVGAAAGGLFGALVGSFGVPEEEARYYDEEFRSGRTIVTVNAQGRRAEAESILREYGAYDATTRGDATGVTGRTELDRNMQLREEELRTRKTSVETGQVSLGKEVVEEQRTVDVPVTREEVYVERHAVDRRPSDRPVTEAEQTIEVPVREERVELEKQPVVYEEVGVGKREVTETESVSETVKREEARIEKEGDVDLDGKNPGDVPRRVQQQ
jgi:uncharacterized protein (TIGR02271 family)